MKIYPYKAGSASAKALSEALGIKRIRHEGPQLFVRDGVLNWGSSHFKRKLAYAGCLNSPDCVAVAGNKLETFKALSGHVPIPGWTEERLEALQWLVEGFDVVARTILTGHSGAGIVIATAGEQEDIVEAPLYTKYIKKSQEYRLHVFRNKVFFTQRKARKLDVPAEQVNWKIRNHQNGFIYANVDVNPTPEMEKAAIIAVERLGLDFGAVDIVLGTDGKVYVLEVNTAPGLSGTTLDKYVEQFKEFV